MTATAAPLEIDPVTARTTADASNPAYSAWVSANAGSGKTFVLSRRVIRLLLAGVDPSRILCLTFTKAAAAEMAKRVFAILGSWTTLADAELAATLTELEGAPPSRAKLDAARRLFARALDTPGGLKIQTIHAFCERLLHQFPFEANVAGHFEVLDERDEKALSDEARRAVLARAAAEPDGALGKALGTVLTLASDYMHEESVGEFVSKRDQLEAWIVACDNLEGAIVNLRDTLGIGPGETADSVRREIVDGALDAATAAEIVAALRAGSPSDRDAAERLATYCAAADLNRRCETWIAFFTTKAGELRGSVVTKPTLRRVAGLDALIDNEKARLGQLIERLKTAELFESSAAMLRLADAAIAEYARLKRQRGVLDFEDLIVKTVALLSRADAARWVQYKLDRGLDHILVDEAQDTSPRQWQVIRALAEEFFAGEGAGAELRTLFAVGDEKQSIYSFQGAVPTWFTREQRELGGQAAAGGYPWKDLELHLSFRSVPVVLEAVDAVFADPAVHQGLTAELKPTLHAARRRNQPGRVVLWPAYTPPDKPDTENWFDPVDHLGVESPEFRLARRIAGTIKGWLDSDATLDALDEHGEARPVRAGGILILTRSRGALTDAINRALKSRGVPIAGADRLTLTEHIAIMDLMALARVVLLPEDDLSLASLLRSPLIGLDEQALFDLAHDRKGTLWAALKRKAGEREDFARARALIEDWRSIADTRDPHAFFARILGPGKGRQAFLRRLGAEAEDVLDEFLAQTLAYEQTNVPTLQGFIAWLVAGDSDVKRDTETMRDEVRVMTVHGAKGLEADIVFLIDNGTPPAITAYDARMLSLADAHDPRNPGPFAWMRSVRAMPQAVRERVTRNRTRDEEEYRRLLYVGMTRAKDWLIVGGMIKQKSNNDRRWHALVKQALEADSETTTEANGDETLEWRATERTARAAAPAKPGEDRVRLPAWAGKPAAPPPAALARLTPSTIGGADEDGDTAPATFAAAGTGAALALARGRLVHRLLESLPEIAVGDRHVVGAAYLAAFARPLEDWPEAERDALIAEVLAVMAGPGFAPVFAPGSRAEVEIAGRISRASGDATVAGRIDRLAVTPERVLIVDYKTNRPAPQTLAEVPDGYVAQLALYRVILRRLYPGRRIEAALLWTDRPALMEIPESVLDSAESAILAA